MDPKFHVGKLFAAAIVVVIAIFGLLSVGQLVENVDRDDYVVIQAVGSGKLSFYTQPGLEPQWFGTVVSLPIRSTFDFRAPEKGGSGGIGIQFNDGGQATLYGTVQFQLPSDEEHLRRIVQYYKDQDALVDHAIKPATTNAVALTGPLMTSKESYAERKSDMIRYVMDQLQNGIYQTQRRTAYVKDPLTGQDTQVVTADIVMGADGKPLRQEKSALAELGIQTFQFNFDSIVYDKRVEDQIQQQREITMQIQTKIAKALSAEQDAKTTEQEGRASATKAKWDQETIKAQAVTQAQQEKEVAETNAQRDKNVAELAAQRDKNVAETAGNQRLSVALLDKQAAEQKKQELTLLGEGEAARKKAVIEADGALSQKLDAYIEVNKAYASALQNARLVPSVIMTGSGSSDTSSNNATNFMNLLSMKAAKDLALDLTVEGGSNVGQ